MEEKEKDTLLAPGGNSFDNIPLQKKIAQGDNQIFSRIQALLAYLSVYSTLVHN